MKSAVSSWLHHEARCFLIRCKKIIFFFVLISLSGSTQSWINEGALCTNGLISGNQHFHLLFQYLFVYALFHFFWQLISFPLRRYTPTFWVETRPHWSFYTAKNRHLKFIIGKITETFKCLKRKSNWSKMPNKLMLWSKRWYVLYVKN